MQPDAANDDIQVDDADVAEASPATLRWLGVVALALLLGWGIRNWTAQNAAQPLPLGPVVVQEDSRQPTGGVPTGGVPAGGVPAGAEPSLPQAGEAGRSASGVAPVPPAAAASANTEIVVHVAGGVNSPGVYRLWPGARAGDAVAAAGGISHLGDADALNLAAPLRDGQRVDVPRKASAQAAVQPAPQPAPAGVAAPLSPGKRSPGELRLNPLDLNLATAEQLSALPGVGPALAARIVNYRVQNNGFRSVAELEQVPGFGEKRLAELQSMVYVR